jgi:hypothetical protein
VASSAMRIEPINMAMNRALMEARVGCRLFTWLSWEVQRV